MTTKYRITVEEFDSNYDPVQASVTIKRFEQVVDDLDLPKLIAAINTKKRGPRPAKKAAS